MSSPLPSIDLLWRVEAVVPFDYGWSKNRMWQHGRRRSWLSPAAKTARAGLARALERELGDRRIRHNRLWLGVNVQKPDHTGDALNVLDLVADAVQNVTGLDDRWFQLGALTWGIDHDKPRILVWLGQEDVPDAQVCARCGEILPFDAFHRNRSTKTGRAGVCRPCASSARAEREEHYRRLVERDQPPEDLAELGERPPW